jgi:hypothetical protein
MADLLKEGRLADNGFHPDCIAQPGHFLLREEVDGRLASSMR